MSKTSKKKVKAENKEVITTERIYKFRTPLQNKEGQFNGGFRIDEIKESELEQQHLDLLMGELLRVYNESPALVKIKFIEDAFKMVKENLDKQESTETKVEEKELLNDIVKDEVHEDTIKD